MHALYIAGSCHKSKFSSEQQQQLQLLFSCFRLFSCQKKLLGKKEKFAAVAVATAAAHFYFAPLCLFMPHEKKNSARKKKNLKVQHTNLVIPEIMLK